MTLRVFFGDPDFESIYELYPFVATIWFYSYVIIAVFIVLNLLTALVYDKHLSINQATNFRGAQTVWSQTKNLIKDFLMSQSDDMDLITGKKRRIDYEHIYQIVHFHIEEDLQRCSVAKSTTNINFPRKQQFLLHVRLSLLFPPSTRPPPSAPPTPSPPRRSSIPPHTPPPPPPPPPAPPSHFLQKKLILCSKLCYTCSSWDEGAAYQRQGRDYAEFQKQETKLFSFGKPSEGWAMPTRDPDHFEGTFANSQVDVEYLVEMGGVDEAQARYLIKACAAQYLSDQKSLQPELYLGHAVKSEFQELQHQVGPELYLGHAVKSEFQELQHQVGPELYLGHAVKSEFQELQHQVISAMR